MTDILYIPTLRATKRAINKMIKYGELDSRLSIEGAQLGNFLGDTILFWAVGSVGNSKPHFIRIKRDAGKETPILHGYSNEVSPTLLFKELNFS